MQTIAQTVEQQSPFAAVQSLIDQANAKDGPDNITAVLMQYPAFQSHDPIRRRPFPTRLTAAVMTLFMLGLVVVGWYTLFSRSQDSNVLPTPTPQEITSAAVPPTSPVLAPKVTVQAKAITLSPTVVVFAPSTNKEQTPISTPALAPPPRSDTPTPTNSPEPVLVLIPTNMPTTSVNSEPAQPESNQMTDPSLGSAATLSATPVITESTSPAISCELLSPINDETVKQSKIEFSWSCDRSLIEEQETFLIYIGSSVDKQSCGLFPSNISTNFSKNLGNTYEHTIGILEEVRTDKECLSDSPRIFWIVKIALCLNGVCDDNHSMEKTKRPESFLLN